MTDDPMIRAEAAARLNHVVRKRLSEERGPIDRASLDELAAEIERGLDLLPEDMAEGPLRGALLLTRSAIRMRYILPLPPWHHWILAAEPVLAVQATAITQAISDFEEARSLGTPISMEANAWRARLGFLLAIYSGGRRGGPDALARGLSGCRQQWTALAACRAEAERLAGKCPTAPEPAGQDLVTLVNRLNLAARYAWLEQSRPQAAGLIQQAEEVVASFGIQSTPRFMRHLVYLAAANAFLAAAALLDDAELGHRALRVLEIASECLGQQPQEKFLEPGMLADFSCSAREYTELLSGAGALWLSDRCRDDTWTSKALAILQALDQGGSRDIQDIARPLAQAARRRARIRALPLMDGSAIPLEILSGVLPAWRFNLTGGAS